jgi:hypothetical protein
MIHYSALPLELAYYDPTVPQLEEMTVDGVTMLVRKEGDGERTVVRLISPDPAHYLDPRFQPGNKLRRTPQD